MEKEKEDKIKVRSIKSEETLSFFLVRTRVLGSPREVSDTLQRYHFISDSDGHLSCVTYNIQLLVLVIHITERNILST